MDAIDADKPERTAAVVFDYVTAPRSDWSPT